MMAMRGLRFFSILLITLSVSVVLKPATDVGAFSGRGAHYGYFYNKEDYSIYGNGNVFQGGITIDMGGSEIDKVDDFVDTLSSTYNGGDRGDSIGASFIYHTMVGHRPGVDSDDVDFNDLRQRLYSLVYRGGYIEYERNVDILGERNTYMQSRIDVAWYTQGDDANRWADLYTFYDERGRPLYIIKKDCANPIGELNEIPEASEWYINGQSYVKKNSTSVSARRQGRNNLTAKPGDTLYWDHDLRNTGPDDMDRSVTIDIDRVDRPIGSGSESGRWANPAGHTGRGDVNELFYRRYNISRAITQNDVGKELCQQISWVDGAWNDGDWYESNYACANVPYEYELTPKVSVGFDVVEPGNEVKANIQVDNVGPTKSHPARWRLTEIILGKGEPMPVNKDGGVSSTEPCSGATGNSYYGNRKAGATGMGDLNDNTGCQVVMGGDNVEFMPGGWGGPWTNSYNRPNGMPDLDAGAHVCYALSVAPYSHNQSEWKHSGVLCYVVSKQPKVQFWGGDVRAGVSLGALGGEDSGEAKKVVTAITHKRNKLFGSWAEYAISAPGLIKSSSGAGLSGGADGRDAMGQRLYNDLTFANASGNFGGFTSGSLPLSINPADYFKATDGADKLLNGYELGLGETVVLVRDGTVEINNNITYNPSQQYNSLFELPQAVIIADNIIVAPDVTQIDAWLIARDSLSTCRTNNSFDLSDGLTASTCNQPLRINGAVVSNKIYLKRTAGGEASDPNIPAEILNLRPDAYMWGYERSQDSGLIKTTYVRELPPRY